MTRRTVTRGRPAPRRPQMLVFGQPDIREAEIAEVVDTLLSGWLGTGPKTKQFEAEFAEYVGVRNAVALNSCTAALHLALLGLGVGPGDEVITSPMTFVSTANVILHVGASPIFVDVDRDSMNIEPTAVESAVTARTRAIMPVHMAGRPVDIRAMASLGDKYSIPVIDDAAHAVEARDELGRPAAVSATASAYSFYATKNVVTGEGGMLTTDDDELAADVRVRSLHGLSRDAWKRYSADGYRPYDVTLPGWKYNMTDMQAALGLHQLRRVEANLARRESIWQRYDEAFASHPLLDIPAPQSRGRHARHLYTLLVDVDRAGISRDKLVDRLRELNIGTGVHFVAIHLHRYYREALGTRRGQYPNAEWISDRIFSLPLSSRLSDDDVEDVIWAVNAALEI